MCSKNDCGWCYDTSKKNNADNGKCSKPQDCVVNDDKNEQKMNNC